MKHSLQFPKMNRFFMISVLTLLLTIQFAISVTAKVVDKVVAVVNNDIITLTELETEATELHKTLARKNNSEELLDGMEEAREMALNQLIDRTLMKQKAQQFNLSVSEDEIDHAFERMRGNMSLSPTLFRKKLQESGISEEQYRAKLRDNILQSKIVSVDVRSKIVVTDEMILEYYNQHYTSQVSDGDFYLLQIGFPWTNKSGKDKKKTQEQALQLARRIHKLALDGQDFKSLAKKFSELPSAVDGGDIGVFTLDEMAPSMREAVKDLPPGEVSSVIELGGGYQFFKLLSAKDDTIVVTSSFEQSKDEIREKLYEIKMQEAYQAWAKELKQSAYIQKL